MRAEIARHKEPKGPLDVKLLRGGLVDVEFLVHFLQLRDRTALEPSLRGAIARLVASGQLPAAVVDAYALLGRLLIATRLLAPDGDVPPPAARAVLAKSCGLADWKALLARLAEARGTIAASWATIFDEQLETR